MWTKLHKDSQNLLGRDNMEAFMRLYVFDKLFKFGNAVHTRQDKFQSKRLYRLVN